MPEFIELKTEHYECIVSSADVTSRQKRLAQTLEQRGRIKSDSFVRFSPAIKLLNEEKVLEEYAIKNPVLFENKQYEFEFVFENSLKRGFANSPPHVEHRLRAIEEAFEYKSRSNALRASINTGNDIGWFKLELVYELRGKEFRQAFSFEVLPTKMDMATDLRIINDAIDLEFPLWRFSLAEKTQHQMQAVKKPHPQFSLLWLAQFEILWGDLNKGLKQIVNAPHSRLIGIQQNMKLDRLKGRLSSRLEQKITHAKSEKNWEKRFQINKKQLNIDTPENRFIKAVVATSIKKLTIIARQSRQHQRSPDKQRLSASFFNTLGKWQSSMQYYHRQPMFREIGEFSGLTKESLVLQQKPGYARVYRIWQQLKWHLALLEGQNNLSLRNISELYEIWCFLEVRRILLKLGFEESQSTRVPMINNGIEVSMKDGMRGAFNFKRKDGIKIRLAHEPVFNNAGSPIKSWITTQIPDILLQVSFTDGQEFVWIFDAKYRIKEDSNEQNDLAPDDAINQMHRYRDALIHQNKSNTEQVEKSRPVFGAFALYPGFYSQKSVPNPYEEAINEIGIGAFSLLPGEDHDGSYWLTEFLAEKLGRAQTVYDRAISDKHFVEESPRISYRGTSISRFTDLTITANQLGPNRSQLYTQQFEKGEAKYYHTRVAAFKRQKIEQHIIVEARYIVVAQTQIEGTSRIAKYIYPILQAQKVSRESISKEQAGTAHIINPDELYWLFTLGESLVLKNPYTLEWDPHFKLNFVGLDDLSKIKDWDALPQKYTSLMNGLLIL